MDAAETRALGPVQLLVVAFEGGRFEGRVLAELRRLREHDSVRLVDLIFVAKDADGDVVRLEQSDLSPAEAAEFGALAGALVGFGSGTAEGAARGAEVGAANAAANGSPLGGEEVWFLADAIPPASAAAIVLLEHRWAIPLRTAIEHAGGHTLDDAWVHSRDLIAIGADNTR
jgi:uncharacterized membrane protein